MQLWLSSNATRAQVFGIGWSLSTAGCGTSGLSFLLKRLTHVKVGLSLRPWRGLTLCSSLSTAFVQSTRPRTRWRWYNKFVVLDRQLGWDCPQAKRCVYLHIWTFIASMRLKTTTMLTWLSLWSCLRLSFNKSCQLRTPIGMSWSRSTSSIWWLSRGSCQS